MHYTNCCVDLFRSKGRSIREFRLSAHRKGPQIVNKFFETSYTFLGLKQLTTTPYHPQTNWQAKRCNKTHVAAFRPCVAEPHCDWNFFVQPLTYAFNTQEHSTAEMTRLAWHFYAYHPDQLQLLHRWHFQLKTMQRTAENTTPPCVTYDK